jgi:hypothetical protein
VIGSAPGRLLESVHRDCADGDRRPSAPLVLTRSACEPCPVWPCRSVVRLRPASAGCAPRGVRDHRGVLRVGLRLTRMQVGDPPYGKPRQVGELAARAAGHRQRQSANRGGLVHDHQDGAELRGELVEHGPQRGFELGSCLSKTFLPARVSPCAWRAFLPTSRPRKTPTSSMSYNPSSRTVSCRAGPGDGAVCAHPRYADLPPANSQALHRTT